MLRRGSLRCLDKLACLTDLFTKMTRLDNAPITKFAFSRVKSRFICNDNPILRRLYHDPVSEPEHLRGMNSALRIRKKKYGISNR